MQRRCKNWLQSFINHTAAGEAPTKMYFWTGVSTLAGALRRKVWINQKHFTWIPNFYVILVAPPGIVSKSTTATLGMRLLRKVPGIHFGPDAVTWPALAKAFADSREDFPLPPDRHGEICFYPMCALTIESSEFGTFLDPQDRNMVDNLVSLWDGKEGAFSKMTKTQGNDTIINPYINFIACTTPAWIEGYFPDYMIGGGFTSRCIFVYADEKAQYVAYPGRHIAESFLQEEEDLIHDLELISQLTGEYVITEAAMDWGEKWYLHHHKNRPAHLDNDRFGGYIARKQTHIHKLAMVLAASESDSLFITPELLQTANDIVTSLEAEMTKVFERIGQTDDTRLASTLLNIIAHHAPITVKDLFTVVFRQMSYDGFTLALKSVVEAGHATLANVDGAMTVRLSNGK